MLRDPFSPQNTEPVEFKDSIDINPKKRELLINGFIHEWNKQQKEDNKQIPNELSTVISKFYPSHEFIFAESGNKIYTKTMHCYGPTTGLLNAIFNDKMCDKVEIEFLIKEGDDDVFVTFGYVHKWKEDEQPGVFYLGHNEESVGIEIAGYDDQPPAVRINEVHHDHESTELVVVGSIIRMVFDFKNDSIGIYHKQDCLCIAGLCDRKRVIAGVCVGFGTDIEFMGCSFD